MFKWILFAVLVAPMFSFGDELTKAPSYKVRGDIAAPDLRALEALTAKLTKQPILGVSAEKDGSIVVVTGVWRGPQRRRQHLHIQTQRREMDNDGAVVLGIVGFLGKAAERMLLC